MPFKSLEEMYYDKTALVGGFIIEDLALTSYTSVPFWIICFNTVVSISSSL